MAGLDLIERFTSQRFVPRGRRRRSACPIRKITIADSLLGAEEALVRDLVPGGTPAVVSDENTYEVMGRRVERALSTVASVVLERPQADETTAARLLERSRGADALVAVGSGTLNDLCKYVGHRTERPVLAAAPLRIIRAGLRDVLCRSTPQVDWLLSHLLLDTAYAEDPFAIQAADERMLLERAGTWPRAIPPRSARLCAFSYWAGSASAMRAKALDAGGEGAELAPGGAMARPASPSSGRGAGARAARGGAARGGCCHAARASRHRSRLLPRGGAACPRDPRALRDARSRGRCRSARRLRGANVP